MLLVHSNESSNAEYIYVEGLWSCVEATPPNLNPNAAAGFC